MARPRSFETNLNRITAKKFIADLSPAHMQTRTVLVLSIHPIRQKSSCHPIPSSTHQSVLWSANGKLILNGKKAILWRLKKKTGPHSLRVSKVYTGKPSSGCGIIVTYGTLYSSYSTQIFAHPLFLSQVHGLHVDEQRWMYDEAISIQKAGLEANPLR